MKDEQAPSGVRSVAISKSETLLVLIVTAATYLYAFASQRAYLASFGVDEIFTSVAIEDVIRTGLWLFAGIFLVFQLIQLPAKFLGWLLMCIWFTRLTWFPLFLGIAAFSKSGATWFSMIAFGIAALVLIWELFDLWRCRRKGMTFYEFFKRDIEFQTDYLKKTGDQKFADMFGNTNWTILIALVFIPYGVGGITGERIAKRQTEFLEFIVDEEAYLVVHEISGVFVGVGYDQSGEEEPILNGQIRILTAENFAQIPLLDKSFKSRLLREKPRDKPTVSDWFRNEFKPLFYFGTNT